ncbi:MAG: YncE family protein, partial [Gammaproteobacteria bacterium]
MINTEMGKEWLSAAALPGLLPTIPVHAVVADPRGRHIYVAGDNLADGSLDTALTIGKSPAAIAVTPDANRIYLTNAPADTIDYYDFGTGLSGEIDLGFGISPAGIAISPDGFKVYVAGNSSSIHVIDVLSDQVIPVNVGGASSSVAISPDGKRAYVTLTSANKVVEIGNQRTMRLSKQGGGIGSVRSEPAGINCGTTCIVSFDSGSQLQLIAEPDSGSNSRFDRWSGDADCSDGTNTSYAPSGLSESTTYYWKVFARDIHANQGVASDVWSFTVIPAGPCTYSISPTSRSFPFGGGAGSISVTSSASSCS